MEDGDPELAPTRKRKFSKREVLALLKERENDLEKVAGEICANPDSRMSAMAATFIPGRSAHHVKGYDDPARCVQHPAKLTSTDYSIVPLGTILRNANSNSPHLAHDLNLLCDPVLDIDGMCNCNVFPGHHPPVLPPLADHSFPKCRAG